MNWTVGVALAALVVATAMGQDAKEAGKEKAMDGERKITGQCHCGFVRYEATGPVVKCSYCDCRGCQRATGTLKAPFVTMRRADVKVTAGKPAEFQARQGEKCDVHGVWLFCPTCGTQLFWRGHKGEELDIFAGTLDDTTIFRPKE